MATFIEISLDLMLSKILHLNSESRILNSSVSPSSMFQLEGCKRDESCCSHCGLVQPGSNPDFEIDLDCYSELCLDKFRVNY